MEKLYLDIETLPADEESHESLKLLFNKKKEKAEERGRAHCDFEQWLLGTSFDGAFGRILCVGYASNDNPVEIIFNDKNESETLKQFWQIAKNYDLFIGHNIMDFDLRFIYQRSIVHRIKPAFDLNFARYRSAPIFDTMKEWVKWNNNSVGLEHLALALGLPTPKDGIDGSQVFEFYKKGKTEDILEYCKRDVETTRAIYKRIVFED
jgi:predicted PolB exonuclease-like 3'-5' exonuclease